MPILVPTRPAILDRTNPLARGLVGYWPMVEGTGGIITDISGNGNTGTITGATWQSSPMGNSLFFDGSTATVMLNANGVYTNAQAKANGWTWYAVVMLHPDWAEHFGTALAGSRHWITTGNLPGGGIRAYSVAADNYCFQAQVYDGAYRTVLNDVLSLGLSDISVPHHVAALLTADGVLDCYVDGVPSGASYDTVNMASLYSTTNSEISSTADEWGGSVIALMVYNRGLTASEINSLYREPNQLIWHPRSPGWISYAAAGGDVTVSPGALNFVASGIITDVELGSTAATPAASSFVLSSVGPGVVLGSLTVSPTAISAVLSSVDPSIAFGSITISPTALSAVLASIDPAAVQDSMTVSPTALSVVLASVDPTVALSGIVVSPTALSAILSGADPTTVLGDITVSPTALSAVLASIDPAIMGGTVDITPNPLSFILASADPSVVLGSTIASPEASFLILAKTDPSIVLGSMSVTPDFVKMVLSKSDPIVTIQEIVAHTMALALGAEF